jgi:hypothetical protein
MLFMAVVAGSYLWAFSQAQTAKIRPSIIRLAKAMARYNQIDSQGIGESGFESEQWDRFDKLCKMATNADLRQLTDYPNAVVRCYAFHAIALRNDPAIFSILVHHLKDSTLAKTLSADIGGSDSVADYFVDVVTPNYIDLKAYKLNKDQKEKLDSILLFDKTISSGAKNDMLRQLKPNERYYQRVKEIAETENKGEGLIALSKYRKLNDTSLIINYLKRPKQIYYALYAAREFPAAAFFNRLVQIFEENWAQKSYDYSAWRLLYQALAQYPRPQTLALFERTLNAEDYFRRQTLGVNLFVALSKYPSHYFENIKTQIKLDAVYKNEVLEQMKANN